MTKVELFECIRRDHMLAGLGVRAIARKRGLHRRMVRQALRCAMPPQRKKPERKRPKLTDQIRSVVDNWLLADQKAPRKQRHTARRIFSRLVAEYEYEGAEATIRAFVGRRRRELGLSSKEGFVPQTHQPGQEAQVDWYEAMVDFPQGRQKVYVLLMRASFSGREFHIAFPQQTQQAFLEGLAQGLEYFGGVFYRILFDNLSSAVKKVLRGRQRVESERFVAFRSHYLFEAQFCRPGVAGAHEKGGVEGAVGRFRRNHLVPVPAVQSFAQLNELLLGGCLLDQQRKRAGSSETVLQQWEQERDKLLQLPSERFPIAEVISARVDDKGRICARTNRYSVPIELRGRRVEVRLVANEVEILCAGKQVARHERLLGRHEERLVLDHYLELLKLKPGAMAASVPLKQARNTGQWPLVYDRVWEELQHRHGQSEGTRQMVEILMLLRKSTPQQLQAVLCDALELGCLETEAIAVLMEQQLRPRPAPETLEVRSELEQYGSLPNSDLSAYEELLDTTGEQEAAA